MSASADCQLIGRWRIVKADLRELLDDGSIEITFAYHSGDEAILKARRDTSSTAC